MKRDTRKLLSMTRAAQSVLHQQIGDRSTADELGYTVAEFVLYNWDIVADEYGHNAMDEMEIVERVTREVVRLLPTV